MVVRERQVDGFAKRDAPGRRRLGLLGECRARTGGKEQREYRSSNRHDWSPVRAWRRARVERRKVAEIQRKSSERRDQDQRRDRHPGDEMKRVDEGERVGLQTNAAGNESDRAAGGARDAGRSARQPRGQEPHRVLRDPVARLNVKPHEIRVQFLLLRDEAGHQRRPDLSAENAARHGRTRRTSGHGMESRGRRRRRPAG